MKSEQDSSHALDLVTVFEEVGTTAEMEVLEIEALLKTAGIRVVVASGAAFPNLPWAIRVPQVDAARARQMIAEAKQAGPQAADEAEAEEERSGRE
jgi:hypothetical protein